MDDIPLGKPTEYKDKYDAGLLVAIPRVKDRAHIGINGDIPFYGIDLWNCYEVSWLNAQGKPEVRILEFIVGAESENIVESKSLKLYLNSFNGTRFDGNVSEQEATVISTLKRDLSNIVGTEVEIKLQKLDSYDKQPIITLEGSLIDDMEIEAVDYHVNSDLLELSSGEEYVEEVLCSNLLKSNCLITNQPDWAALQIIYKGKKIDHGSLLKYIISYRNHSGFHEQCVERIFVDIMKKCSPESLTIFAKYTRRGGIDISPIRSSEEIDRKKLALYKLRDVRQ